MEIEALELEGFETTRVRAGADTADVVLLDLGLPDLDGREVCLPVRGRTGGGAFDEYGALALALASLVGDTAVAAAQFPPPCRTPQRMTAMTAIGPRRPTPPPPTTYTSSSL